MADPYVRPVDCIADVDGGQLRIGVNYDTISLGMGGVSLSFDSEGAETLGYALVRASWEAGANAERMRAETGEPPATATGEVNMTSTEHEPETEAEEAEETSEADAEDSEDSDDGE